MKALNVILFQFPTLPLFQDLLEANRNMSYTFQPILPPSTIFNEATGNFVQNGNFHLLEHIMQQVCLRVCLVGIIHSPMRLRGQLVFFYKTFTFLFIVEDATLTSNYEPYQPIRSKHVSLNLFYHWTDEYVN